MKKVIFYSIMCLIWGTTWMAIKVGLEDLTPVFSLSLRLLISGVLLLFFILVKEKRFSYDKNQFKIIAYLTLFNYIVPYVLIYWGELHIYSDLAAIIVSTHPFFTSLISLKLLHEERFSLKDNFGIFVGFCGVLIIFSENLFSGLNFHFLGMFAIFLSSLSFAFVDVILRKYKDSYHPLRINVIPLFISGTALMTYSLFFENIKTNSFTSSAVISVLYLAIFGTVITFTILLWLIQRIKLSIITLATFIIPIIAIIVGWIFLNEALTKLQIFGTVFVLTGVLINTTTKKS